MAEDIIDHFGIPIAYAGKSLKFCGFRLIDRIRAIYIYEGDGQDRKTRALKAENATILETCALDLDGPCCMLSGRPSSGSVPRT